MKVQLSAPAINTGLMFAHVFWGAGYAFGPPRLMSSGSYRVAVSWLPATWWGWLFLAGAACCLVAPHLPRAGSAALRVVAMVPLAGFAVALAGAQLAGYSEGWGGVLTYLVAITFHVLLVRARFTARPPAEPATGSAPEVGRG